VKNLSTTIAVYSSLSTAQKDWDSLEAAAKAKQIDLADAALIEHPTAGETVTVHRQSHHGWGKGAVAGAVVGVLFPPALIGATVVGAGGGAVVARMNRSLDRGDIKDLGEVMDSGEVALVALTHSDSVTALTPILAGATKRLTRASSTAEDVQEALKVDKAAAAAKS